MTAEISVPNKERVISNRLSDCISNSSKESLFPPNDTVLQRMLSLQQPLLDTLAIVMGDKRARELKDEKKRWALCGPACVVLTRIINSEQEIPITRERAVEKRLELDVGLHIDENGKLIDHVYIKYFSGEKDAEENEIFYMIDPTYEANFEEKGRDGKLVIQKHTQDTVDAALAENYALYPPSYNPEFFLAVGYWHEDDSTYQFRASKLPDFLDALHTDKITQPVFRGASGAVRRSHPKAQDWAAQVTNVIRHFVPNWDGIKNGEQVVWQP